MFPRNSMKHRPAKSFCTTSWSWKDPFRWLSNMTERQATTGLPTEANTSSRVRSRARKQPVGGSLLPSLERSAGPCCNHKCRILTWASHLATSSQTKNNYVRRPASSSASAPMVQSCRRTPSLGTWKNPETSLSQLYTAVGERQDVPAALPKNLAARFVEDKHRSRRRGTSSCY